MQETLHFNSQFCLSKPFLLQNPVCNLSVTYYQSHYLSTKTSLCYSLHSLPHQTQIQNVVICARKRKRGPGYQKLRSILPQLMTFLASNTKILPEPLSLAIAEFCGESGGGVGFLKGFGWGSFDGWRRKRKKSFGFNVVSVISGFLLLLLLVGRELKSEVLVGILMLGLLGALVTKKFKRRFKDLVLGLCFVVALAVLGLRRGEMQKCVQKLTVCSPVLKLVKKPRRNGRRLF